MSGGEHPSPPLATAPSAAVPSAPPPAAVHSAPPAAAGAAGLVSALKGQPRPSEAAAAAPGAAARVESVPVAAELSWLLLLWCASAPEGGFDVCCRRPCLPLDGAVAEKEGEDGGTQGEKMKK
ncbi:unnamed protein product [Closterium sp. NIES-54]